MLDIRGLVSDFAEKLSSVLHGAATQRARALVESALGGFGGPRRGRPPRAIELAAKGRKRRKGPIQLCPVPGCKNPAAPVFGMVCAKHKDLPKAKIKKYREARRAKKLKKAA